MSQRVLGILAIAVFLWLASAGTTLAGLIWFDETNSGQTYDSFAALASDYQSFVGEPQNLITFNELAQGTHLSNQYCESDGITFLNSAGGSLSSWSGVRNESTWYTESLTGYDGSYMPDGDAVYSKFDNDRTDEPFTFVFDQPVATVGAFVGMGCEGSTHRLTISLFDSGDQLISQSTVDAWLWETSTSGQNYESFFAVSSDTPNIARVEILNNAQQNYANGLMIDNLAFSVAPAVGVPEPTTLAFLGLGTGWLFFRRDSQPRPA